ncbi:hypothetical protein CsSME_00032791 [Camellia sinensis var. sinensis]
MRDKSLCSWWCLSSFSLMVFGLIVPLILVSRLMGLVGQKNSNWVFDSNKLYPWAWSSVILSSSSSSSSCSSSSSTMYESILYHSSPPPLSINPIHRTQPLSVTFENIYIYIYILRNSFRILHCYI